MTSTSLFLRCIGRRADTHDVTSWQFVAAEGTLPPVLAGQCVTLHTEIDGQPLCRAYTLSSSPQDACWQVTIKDVGLVSHHLHQSRDHQNKDDRLHVFDPQRHQYVSLNRPCNHRSKGHNEGHGSSHTERSFDFRRHAQERADAEELSQHDVIDEDRADDNGKIRELHTYFLRNLLNNAIRYPSTIKAPGASTNTNGM